MGIDLGRFRSKKNEEWVDWLADDPVPASIRSKMRAKAVQEASQPVVRRVGQQSSNTEQAIQKQSAGGKEAAVSINISIPKFTLAKPRIKIPEQVITHKKWAIGGLAGVVLIAGFLTTVIITQGSSPEEGTPAVLSAAQERPNFKFLLPGGDANGKVFQYNKESQTVSYADSIGGVRIVIHQTPLNNDLKQDTESKIAKIAQDQAFTEKIVTANPTAYMGTSAKGPQTILFAKNDLQVFIKSDKKIDEHDWAEYVTNLK